MIDIEVTYKICSDCKENLSLDKFCKGSGFYGVQPWCKKCRRKRELDRRAKAPVHAQLTIMADGILKRTKYVHCTPYNLSYKERGIQCKIGNTLTEVRETLKKHFAEDVKYFLDKGIKPSVDRIDPYGHYEIGNIQIISMKENRRRADMSHFHKSIIVTDSNGNSKEYQSIKQAAKDLNYSRNSIWDKLKTGKPSVTGHTFKYKGVD